MLAKDLFLDEIITHFVRTIVSKQFFVISKECDCKHKFLSFFNFLQFFIHGGPINQEWLLFRGPEKET